MTHVFISYSRHDTAFVEKLERALQARSIIMWRDVHSIPGGAKWFRRIKQGLESSYAMLYIDTISAEQSDWVEKEFLFAQNLQLPIIPVKYDPAFMSFQTININPVLCDESNFEAGIGKIVARLAQLDKTPIVPNTTAPSIPEDIETGIDNDWATGVEDEIDYTDEVRHYVDWLLVQSKADLREALYVNLEAMTEARSETKADNPFSFGLDLDADMSLGFEPLGLEHIRGEAFDKVGEAVPDARVPVSEHQRVILLGEPGSGKTTTLLQLAVDLARQVQANPQNALIPVFVPLRKYDGALSLEQFVRKQMYNLQDAYADLLQQGKLIFLLDALNEMPRKSNDGRDLVADVRQFTSEKARWVVSCRVRDYQEELKDIADVSKVRLQSLDPPRIKDVILRRFQEQFAPQGIATEADGQALWDAIYGTDDLLHAWQVHLDCDKPQAFWGTQWNNAVKPEGVKYNFRVQGYNDWRKMASDKRRMMQLCRNPYMTKMVSDIYAIDKSLPDNRGALFKKFVDKLLDRDAKLAKSVGAKWIKDALIRRGLSQIAYRMGAETEMPRTQAQTILRETLPDTDHDLLLCIAQGASLLDVGADVRFTHQLLQEYFASEVMGALVDQGVDPKTIWKTDSWWKPTGREETAIILAGVRGDPESIARWIAPAQPEFAVQVLQESGVPIDLEQLEPTTRQAILESANAKRKAENPVERAAAYRVLGLLHADNRKGVGTYLKGDITLPDIEWVNIPAGDFTYQDRTETINYDFEIARYPVTNAQFQTFVDDPEGYANKDRWFAGLHQDAFQYEINTSPRFNYPNHPRVDVNWYQAMAFCRWLSWRLSTLTPQPPLPNASLREGEQVLRPEGEGFRMRAKYDPMNPTTWLVRLPTEMEWEKVARANTGWTYPWGDGWGETRCNNNVGDNSIGQTSAVGIFPSGDTPHWAIPVADMSGNVWEWCLTEYETENNNDTQNSNSRVLRGGSWDHSDSESFRAGYRGWSYPSNGGNSFGFRVSRWGSMST